MAKKKETPTAEEQGFPPVEKLDASKFVENRKKENNSNFTNLEVKEFYKPAEVKMIEVSEIHPSSINPRKTFDDDSLNELSKNISQQGILQPITVRQMDNKRYEIVCGERRYRAANIAGLTFVPCIVRNLSDDDAFDVMITENLQRKDVEPMEEAVAFKQLLELRNYDIDSLCSRFGKSQTFIRQRLKLNELIEPFKELLQKEIIKVGHAMEICKLDTKCQQELYEDDFSEKERERSWWECPSVSELKRGIDNNFLNSFDKAIFDKEDPTLIEAVGPCANCSKNTACNTFLFPEMKEANCIDSNCFRAKIKAHIEREILRLQNEEPDTIIVHSHYSRGGDDDIFLEELKQKSYNIVSENNTGGSPLYGKDYNKEDDRKYIDSKVATGEYLKIYFVTGYSKGEFKFHVAKSRPSSAKGEDAFFALKAKDIRNKEIQQEKTLEDTKDLIKGTTYHKLNDELSELEEQALFICILDSTNYKTKKELDIDSYGSTPDKILKIAKGLTREQKNEVFRSFIMKHILDNQYSSFGKLFQDLLLQVSEEKYPQNIQEIKLKHEGVYLKRQENINKKIAELKK